MSQEWATPEDFWKYIKTRWNPDIDVCASPSNAKCKRFITPEQDGLDSDWFVEAGMVAWCNPGFKNVAQWLEKAWLETQRSPRGSVALVLGLYDPSTWWWKELAMRASTIYEIAPRIQFEAALGIKQSSNTKPNALFEFGGSSKKRGRIQWKKVNCPVRLKKWAAEKGLQI